jgi:DNA-binding transcriptional LysR family regulator
MHRGDLADLTAFVAVADELSFRAAAVRVGVTPSALSHAMRQLEERLGVRLLHRTTRSVALTDQGRRLLERLRPAITQIAGALEDLDQERRRPSGRLRIHASAGAAAAAIAPVWDRFLAAYPDVHLELQVDDAPVDIVAKGFDAAIGIRERAAVDMVAVRVTGPMKVTVVGAPAYFARRPAPRTPDDLAHHSCIQYRWGDGVFVWPFQRNGQSRRISVRGPVTVNSPGLAVRAAVDGLGIAYAIEPPAAPFIRSGQLVRVLEDWLPPYEGYFLYYPGHRQVPTALRALIDMLRAGRDPLFAIPQPIRDVVVKNLPKGYRETEHAAPVFDRNGDVVCGIGMSAPALRFPSESVPGVAALVMREASLMSRELETIMVTSPCSLRARAIAEESISAPIAEKDSLSLKAFIRYPLEQPSSRTVLFWKEVNSEKSCR